MATPTETTAVSRAAQAVLRDVIRARGDQRRFAHAHGLTESYVSRVRNGRIAPGPRMLAALGLARVVSVRAAQREEPR